MIRSIFCKEHYFSLGKIVGKVKHRRNQSGESDVITQNIKDSHLTQYLRGIGVWCLHVRSSVQRVRIFEMINEYN